MVPANKILTVAYGTFSCTLEGFDDPFSTMTDIAEYFRDLAADDRFFGAEPPTPDMAMLRTIAETRAKHAVTAQPDESGVTLRPTEMPAAAAVTAAFDAHAEAEDVASDTMDVTAPTIDAPATEEVELPVEAVAQDAMTEEAAVEAIETPELDAVDDTSDTPEQADEEVSDAEEDSASSAIEDAPTEDFSAAYEYEDEAGEAEVASEDSVAAKLARIRNVVEADRQASSVYAEDEHAEDMMDDETDMDADMADDTLAAAFAADALNEDPVEETDLDDAAKGEEPVFADDDLLADRSAGDQPIGEDTLSADLAALLSPDVAEVEDVDLEDTSDIETPAVIADEAEPDHAAEAEAPVDEIEDQAAEEISAEMDAPEAEEASAEEDETAEEETLPRRERRIRVRRVRRVQAAAEAAAAAAEPEDEAEEGVIAEVEPAAVRDDAPIFEEASIDPVDEDEDELMSELAAIEAELIRDATGDAVAETQVAEEETAEAGAEDSTEETASEDDDDLMAELAAIRAEDAVAETDDAIAASVNADDIEETDAFEADVAASLADGSEAESDDLPEDVAAEEEIRAEAADAADAEDDAEFAEAESEVAGGEDEGQGTVPSAPDMERLFAATDSRLSGEDTSRRHANISHLKAAVAARRADGPVEAKEEAETEAYRADLASTVRPRRNVPAAETPARTPRPERPAPLVLVSEQRVEDTPEADATPVQPRRAPRTAEIEVREEALAGAEDFEAFASDVGASDLADILEAAAVYSAKVMGQDNFSRPRLLHLAAEAVEDMSREDGLRGFGQLLRDGTIRKVSRGTFALAADSRYADEAERRAG